MHFMTLRLAAKLRVGLVLVVVAMALAIQGHGLAPLPIASYAIAEAHQSHHHAARLHLVIDARPDVVLPHGHSSALAFRAARSPLKSLQVRRRITRVRLFLPPSPAAAVGAFEDLFPAGHCGSLPAQRLNR